jgi:GNAT superfamily N-acetyltransferase
MTAAKPKFEFFPATADRWADVEALFGSRGACGGCWCMTWRLPRAEFNRNKGDANRHALHELMRKGPAPGVLAYADGKPAGWCAVARSRILKPVDSQPVWSISCLFVEKSHRRQGLSTKLIQAATKFAQSQGAKAAECCSAVPVGLVAVPVTVNV